PTVITAGDIDADGDLDAWIGQYKSPYSGGQMPTPYFDANDGYPAYLLRNDGSGIFKDITESGGLSEKRNRRTYSASLVDLDGDRDLDLVVVSDFSGVDVYTNDGTGNFSDVTERRISNRHAFGMSLSFSDYNSDSELDFFMTGMSSTTAMRLHAMDLGQEKFQEYQSIRPEMGYGNRLYLAEGQDFNQAPFNDQVARTGWSWGSTSFDFDNDGDRDIFVANGHKSQRTAKDYCTAFWCHDIYTGTSNEDKELGEFFKMTSALNFRAKGISWNGFEHNKLLMNQDGKGFLGIGFLAGVASELDSRNVISDDFNGDGRVDLVGLYRAPINRSPSVHVLQNRNVSDANWIGVRLDGTSRSGLGARVTVKTPSQIHVAAVVSGDSYISQHASVAHFGLGSSTQVKQIEINWPDGASVKIPSPEINRYHRIQSADIIVSKATVGP
ncbi:MAG: FG-GAP-like repeat-containing protein, partial [Planctomycetaceae bacterium]